MRSFDATFFSHVVERGVADFRFTLECPVETRSSAVMPFLLAEPLTSRKALGGHMVVEADFVALVHKVCSNSPVDPFGRPRPLSAFNFQQTFRESVN